MVPQHVPKYVKYYPYEHIYCKYTMSVPESLYYRDKQLDDSPFNEMTRLKLNTELLQMRPQNPDGSDTENLKIKRYIRKGYLIGCFA